ncbi:hypothetical protein DH09_14615 [Bacillaceae bacterium JMAK1]|nr:hypothetical protein DH09_14615 [Bacillaceae bacterium JMAK1]
MYFVDRKLIYARLLYMDGLYEHYLTVNEWQQKHDQLALERIAQGYIEAMIDVGNQMIDGFIMRDPGSYQDILDILEDEKVLTKEEAASLLKVLNWRKVLVEGYLNVDHGALSQTLTNEKEALQYFSTRIKTYLDQELGPVSAFLPEEEDDARS